MAYNAMLEGNSVANFKQLLELRDGRKLEIIDNGISSERALLFMHGNPGVAEIWWTWLMAAADQNVRAIAVSRPGFHLSDRKEGRCVFDVNKDWQELLEQCSVVDFVTIGWSAGSPYSMASSFLAGNKGVQLIGALGSLKDMGAEAFAVGGINPIEDDLAAAESLENALTQFEGAKDLMSDFEPSFFDDFVPTRDSYAEHAVHYREIRPHFVKMATDALMSPIGVSEDQHMIYKDWGFDIGKVAVSVDIWQGEEDKSTPMSHGEWLFGKLKNATLHRMPNQGHTTIIIECRDQILSHAIERLKS